MDQLPDACPPSPASSDSDEYNTETSRVYFGPVKTPERKFVAASQGLFPPPDAAGALRRSPRLSSPRLRSVSPMSVEAAQTDKEDIEVELLVNTSDDEDSGEVLDSRTATPLKGDDTIDEPSSALAEKILHAHDNPSPPPSPPSALRIFDPYHTTTTEQTNDYQSDLMFLNISDQAPGAEQGPSMDASMVKADAEIFPLPGAGEPGVQSDVLIPIDPTESPAATSVVRAGSLFPSNVTLSVDDLLLKSPSPQKVPASQAQQVVPEVIIEGVQDDIIMASDAPQSSLQAESEPGPSPQPEAVDENVGDVQDKNEPTTTAASPNNLVVTPLRRSTRPRRSVTPNVLQETPPVATAAAPQPSATKIRRKKPAVELQDEVVSDSQDEVERRPLASEMQGSTPGTSTVRVRHRSPAKNLPSFHRELGSLSPTSSNVLSTLNFTAPDPPSADITSALPSSSAAPMLSFSVFTPPVDTPAPSTPVRSTGPIRFASTTKVGAPASPTKFTLQPPAPNDPTNTPARRVPVSQAIAEGRMSPEKSTQAGFRFSTNTPLPSVPTPARRVLISEGPPSMVMKSSTMRLASPTRSTGQRARSAEPTQRLGSSLKGKEKATQPPQESVGVVPKLPFPLVAAASTTTESSATMAQALPQDNLAKAKASPVKSSLRQPTSRIPRIGAKPYARAPEPKAAEKAKTIRKVETVIAVKPLPKSSTSETASSMRKNVRAVEPPKVPAASTSRVKPAVSTTATVLKRKREQSSPVKPRIVRQVPQVVVPAAPTVQPAPAQAAAADSTSKAPKAKKAASGTRQIRRVMDPEPPKEPPAQQQPQDIQLPPSPPPPETVAVEQNMTDNVAAPSIPVVTVSQAPESPLPQQQTELVPGSPMKQDPPLVPETSTKLAEDTPAFNDIPQIVVDAPETGLRRTTRSKRAPIRDVFTEGSSRQTTSRRKPVTFHSDDVFSGMSVTALKDLTVSNTVKNQRYLTARLETEVVRREGLRPESPAVKIKTIVQRQQDERDRRNHERARRRERRGDGGMTDADHSSDIDIDDDDAGYSSQVDELMDDDDSDAGLPKHTRGAGEEEDFVTPERVRRSYQGTRLFGDANDMQQEEAVPKRRVKWDRGLFTTVYLDEVKLGSRQYSKENRDLKGILAPTAKAIRLDTLGNHPHAESPLVDLVPENVTVKKIIYDDDEAPVAPAPAPKPTRSKGKKK